MKREKSICLVSGGLDSCVAAAIAATYTEPAFLHINYGQLTETRELEAFNAIADYYGVKNRLVADVAYLKAIGGSALTDSRIEVPVDGLGKQSVIPVTYVPFRNTHLISIAVSWAEATGAAAVFIGATEVDSSGYPDCRQEYFDAFNRLIQLGTRPDTNIRILTPIIKFSKAEVVNEGLRLGAPLHLTWSCYKNSKKACGRCDSCLLRLKGFAEAHEKDPIPYE